MAVATKRRSGFGDILRAELDAQDVSIRELARRLTAGQDDRLESCRRTLMRYVSGDVAPGMLARTAIANALGIDKSVFAEEREQQARREKLMLALEPLADVLLALAVEVGQQGREVA
jgi:transcriptional regulator with XRE-family HTH domain